MFRNVLFDLDNTIYDYDYSHKTALNVVLEKISKNNNINLELVKNTFNQEKDKFQNVCYNNASSHNKFIQLKKLFESLNLELVQLDNIYQIYLNTFNESLNIYPYLLDFLKLCKKNKINMYILTNNTCQEQISRLNKMNIINYFEKIYTSEEFGIEKPDIKLFYYIITDIGCNKNEIVKIGDNFNNDINSVKMYDIYSFWFNKNSFKINDKYIEFNNYKDIYKFFEEYFILSEQFVKISNSIGERFDLVQAGGGNTSFKLKEIMFIKSSGCNLSDIDINKNYVGLNYCNIKNNIYKIESKNKKELELLSKNIVDSNITFLKDYKPSIETTLHTLTKKFTVHIHPIQFNYISSSSNCEKILEELFNKKDYCVIDYFTPGIEVTKEIIKKYNNENIIFLKNHGLVFTSDDINIIKSLTDESISKIEKYCKLNLEKYKFVNFISNNMNLNYNDRFISYLSEDCIISDYINNNKLDNILIPFFPDKLVYCGTNFINCNINLKELILKYEETYKEQPKIFVNNINNNNYLYITSKSIKKCQEIEAVLKSHFICYQNSNNTLSKSEIEYLNNWDAERYRKKL